MSRMILSIKQIMPPKDLATLLSVQRDKRIWHGKNDYYNWISNAKEARLITITEDLELGAMTSFQKLLWWIGICFQMVTLTIVSLRTDRLVDWDGYLKHHRKHYSGKLRVIAISKINRPIRILTLIYTICSWFWFSI